METFTETKINEDMERNNLATQTEIKPSTARAYVRNIIKLLKLINGTSYSSLITEFDKLKDFFSQKQNDKPLFSDNTIKNYLNCILMVRSWDLCKDINSNQVEPIINYYTQVKEKILNNKLDNVKTEKQQEEWINPKEFNTILKKMRKQVDNNGTPEQLQDFVIMLLYSGKWIRPLRNDYAGMYFSHLKKESSNYIWVQENKDASDNVIDRRFTIVLNDDKVSKHYGAKEYKIAKLTILSNYLDLLYQQRDNKLDGFIDYDPHCKRDFLVNPQDNNPMSKNNLTKNLQRITQTWLNKKVSTSALRHMYISNLDYNKITNKKLNQIAKDMRHSIKTQQENYKVVDA